MKKSVKIVLSLTMVLSLIQLFCLFSFASDEEKDIGGGRKVVVVANEMVNYNDSKSVTESANYFVGSNPNDPKDSGVGQVHVEKHYMKDKNGNVSSDSSYRLTIYDTNGNPIGGNFLAGNVPEKNAHTLPVEYILALVIPAILGGYQYFTDSNLWSSLVGSKMYKQ